MPGPVKIRTEHILIVMLILGFSLRALIAFQGLPLLIEKTLVDDTFYQFKAAKYVSMGEIPSYDGINPTNGFQILSLLISALSFFMFGDNIAVQMRFFLLLSAAASVMSGFFIYKTIRLFTKKEYALLGAFLWVFNPFTTFISLNGLESAINVFFLSFAIYFYADKKKKDKLELTNLIALAAILAGAIYARMDNVLLLFAICLDMMFIKKRFISNAIRSAMLGFGTILLMLPWFAWNYLNFGMIQQMSGVINKYTYHYGYTSLLSIGFLKETVSNLLKNLGLLYMETGYANIAGIGKIGYSYFHTSIASIIISALVFGTLILLGLKSKKRLADSWNKLSALNFTILYCVLNLFYYAFMNGYLTLRYLLPVIYILTIYLVFTVRQAVLNLNPRNKRSMLVGFALFSLFCFISAGITFWSYGRSPWQKQMYEGALWINENLPQDAIVSAFNAGVYGYFCNRTLINLDGVINNNAADSIMDHELFHYMQEQGINYYVDADGFIDRYGPFLGPGYDEGSLELVHRIDSKVFGDDNIDLGVYKVRY